MLNWYKQYEIDLGFYNYKGHLVSAKTEKEKMAMAKKYKSKHYLDVSKPPSQYFFILTSDTEESIDAEIKGRKEITKSFAVKVEASLSPRQLKKKRQEDLMKSLSSLVELKLKKKPLIAKMRGEFPKLSSAQICRFVNNQLKLKVIAIDTKYKTKPIIIKGKYWRV